MSCVFQLLKYERVKHVLSRYNILYTSLSSDEIGKATQFRRIHPYFVPGHNKCHSLTLYTCQCQINFSSSWKFLSIFFFQKGEKEKWKEGKKEGRASLLESDATSTPEIFSGKSSVVTFLWSQSNDWPEDSPYVETCSYAVRYWNLEPLKWRSSWTWFWIKWY